MVPGLVRKEVSFDLNTAEDKAYIALPGGGEIVRVYVAGATTDAGGATVKFDSLQGTTRGDGDLGEITIPAASIQGQTLEEDSAAGTAVAAGGMCIVEVTAEGAASGSIVVAGIEYIDHATLNTSTDSVDDG